MNKQFEIRTLSELFYQTYPHHLYPEFEAKRNRPYFVAVFQYKNIKFALPFRSNIRHANGYKFKNTDRITNSSTGLDYSKAIIITNDKMLGEEKTVDKKEFIEIENKFHFIVNSFLKYIKKYKTFQLEENKYYLSKKFKYTTLSYFKEIIMKNF